MCAGYTIHTVVALAHAGLIPLEQQEAVQQGFQQCAPLLSTTPDALIALVDKSLPTMIGLGGESLSHNKIDGLDAFQLMHFSYALHSCSP